MENEKKNLGLFQEYLPMTYHFGDIALFHLGFTCLLPHTLLEMAACHDKSKWFLHMLYTAHKILRDSERGKALKIYIITPYKF